MVFLVCRSRCPEPVDRIPGGELGEDPETGQAPVGGLSGSAAPVHGGGNMTLREYIIYWQETYDKSQRTHRRWHVPM